MEIGDILAQIIEEAEGQGFLIRQTRNGMWQFRRGGFNLFASVDDAADLIEVLRALISAGFDFSLRE